ncbi:MAG: TolC family protein, partial [Gemmataceae bacterium]
QERLKLAQEEVKYCQRALQKGHLGFDALVPAYQHLLKAELELAAKKVDRIAAYERSIKVMEQSVQHTRILYESGSVTLSDYLKAQYLLIDVKIDLEREKAHK